MKPSLQYTFAQQVIDYLRNDPLLSKVVEKTPFDSTDQVAGLELAGNQYGVSVLVSPAGVAAPSDELNHSSLEVSAAVEVFTTKNMDMLGLLHAHGKEDERIRTAAELAAIYQDYIIARLLCWPRTAERSCPYEQPRISSILEAEVDSKLPNHRNLIGHAIIIKSMMHYKDYYGYSKPLF